MTDQYRDAAEYIDIMSRPAWRFLAEPLTEALQDGGAADGPMVDVGAGTGLGTLVIAAARPDADVVAVEPSTALRAVLLARLVDDPALARRTTVLDTVVEDAELPDTFGAVVAMNMLGHLNPDARLDFWSILAKRLAPDAPAVLNLQPPAEATYVEPTQFTSVEVGRRRYEGWGGAEPRDADSVIWHMRYRTYERDVFVAERTVDYVWWTVSEARLTAEVTAVELDVRPVGPEGVGVYVVRKPA